MFLTGAWGTDVSLGCEGGSGWTGSPLQISFKDDMPSLACYSSPNTCNYSGFEVTCPDCDLKSALDHAARD